MTGGDKHSLERYQSNYRDMENQSCPSRDYFDDTSDGIPPTWFPLRQCVFCEQAHEVNSDQESHSENKANHKC